MGKAKWMIMLALIMSAVCGCMAALPYAMPAVAGLNIGTSAYLTSHALGKQSGQSGVPATEMYVGGPYPEVFKISKQALKNLGISAASADLATGIILASTNDGCEIKIQVIKKTPKMTWIKITQKGAQDKKEDFFVPHLLAEEIKRLAEAAD